MTAVTAAENYFVVRHLAGVPVMGGGWGKCDVLDLAIRPCVSRGPYSCDKQGGCLKLRHSYLMLRLDLSLAL